MVYGEKMHIAINIVKWNENKWINIAHGIQFNRVKEKHNKKSIADIFVFIFCVYTKCKSIETQQIFTVFAIAFFLQQKF